MGAHIQWLTPSPLWNEFASSADKRPFRSPALLRFATDTFMEDLQSLLAKTPGDLRNYVAQSETWRSPAVGLGTGATGTGVSAAASMSSSAGRTASVLKFFQPAHARFYLVAASLACRLPGLPDHQVKLNQGERTTFVLRKLQPKGITTVAAESEFDIAQYDEYAWIPNDSGGGWQPLTDANNLAGGEEQLPLFNVQFGSNGTQRRIFAGLVPVGKRQTYVAGRAIPSPTNGQATVSDDPRKIEFQRQVLDPWANLVQWYANLDPSSPPAPNVMAAAQGSAYILIDFANYVSVNLLQVWAAVQDASQATALSGAQLALYKALGATMGSASDSTQYTIAKALVLAKSYETDFESEVLSTTHTLTLPGNYPGPLLTDTQLNTLIGRPDSGPAEAGSSDPPPKRQIQTLIEAALDQVGPAPLAQIPSPAKDPQNAQGNDWFVIRCVYERPQCTVRPLPKLKQLPATPILSPPTQFFQLASFFDPDAPARRVQVALPVDTTPAALRKYDKGVAFMISDQLNQQMQRIKGLKQLTEGQVDDPSGYGLGMICSFSIPIITICAFVVLMIFLILLNIVFFWMPFFKICFPIPKLTAKS